VKLPALSRNDERRVTWVTAILLATVLGSAAAALAQTTGNTPAPRLGSAAVHVTGVDIVPPTPIAISFAKPVTPVHPSSRPAATPKVTAPAPTRVRPVVSAPTSALCSGTGWQQRRGAAALASLQHPTAAGVTISFLPGGGALKGMTYYDRHHVDVFVASCSRESAELLRHVVAHEMGHAWDSVHMTDDLRAQYLAARGIPAGTPWFGCNACQDFATPAGDFAETYAQWQRGASDSRTQISHPASPAELARLGAQFFS
jgi:hypothetical protein